MKVNAGPVAERQMVLEIVPDQEEVERSLNEACRRVAQQVNIPGFRRGKAPRPVIERFVGKEALMEEAIQRLGPQLYSQAVKEQSVEAIGQGLVEVKERAPLTFRATVPLKPVVELGDYKSLRLAPDPVIVTDDEVEQVVERLRALHALWQPQDRPVQLGDMVTMDLEGTVSGEAIFKQTDLQYRAVAGGTNPMAGFPEALVGIAKGEARSFTLSFSADYADTRLAGQPCLWAAAVKEIKEERLPELNDEFAQAVGDKHESLAALRQALAAEIRGRKEAATSSVHQQRVVDALVEQARIEYPPLMVEWELDNILREQARRLAERRISVDEYLAQEKKTAAQLREELRPQATRNLRQSLVLGKVAEAEGVQVTAEEVEAEVDTVVKALGDQGQRARQALAQPEARYGIELHLLAQKSLARLEEIARSGTEAPPA
ncbi:MAG: trigger factor [Chloroflexi bacterium]|nr:trigger factor [Chloroflexota bacterium]